MTDPTDRPPATTNLVADELRGILSEFDEGSKVLTRQRLRRLLDHVEQIGTTVIGELDAIAAGLDPEQECRAQAARAIGWRSPGDTDTSEYAAWWWAELDRLAAWISDGSRP